MTTDKVGDFIIRLQNAARIGKRSVTIPYSSHLLAIANKLRELGFIDRVEVDAKEGTHKILAVTLAYTEGGEAKLRGVKRVSSPGRRQYVGSAAAHTVKGRTGARIISSPAGIVSDTEARQGNVGGENLFEIW